MIQAWKIFNFVYVGESELVSIIFPRVFVGAGNTFDWLFFDNSKLIDFDC
jgi:hypothetical protein